MAVRRVTIPSRPAGDMAGFGDENFRSSLSGASKGDRAAGAATGLSSSVSPSEPRPPPAKGFLIRDWGARSGGVDIGRVSGEGSRSGRVPCISISLMGVSRRGLASDWLGVWTSVMGMLKMLTGLSPPKPIIWRPVLFSESEISCRKRHREYEKSFSVRVTRMRRSNESSRRTFGNDTYLNIRLCMTNDVDSSKALIPFQRYDTVLPRNSLHMFYNGLDLQI